MNGLSAASPANFPAEFSGWTTAMPRQPSFAAADVERQPPARGHQLEKLIAMKPPVVSCPGARAQAIHCAASRSHASLSDIYCIGALFPPRPWVA